MSMPSFHGPSGSGFGPGNPGTPSGKRPANPLAMSSMQSSVVDDTFTAQMKDRQARGKDPYLSDGSDNGGGPSTPMLRLGQGRSHKDDFYRVEARQKAMAFLDSPELLQMYALSTGETVARARLHFTKLLCGYDEEPQQQATGPSAQPRSRRDHQHRSADRRRDALEPRAGPS